MPSYKIEIGFEKLAELGSFFTLDSATKGRLDNATYVLAGGGFFYDVTNYVKEISIDRGKSRELDRYTAGNAIVTFNNNLRTFDPTYIPSPFYGEIVPKRKLRISADGVYQFVGIIDDWNLSYSPSGESIAEATASDGFVILANTILTEGLTTPQLSGARVNAILDDVAVLWPAQDREIDTGDTYLGEDTIAPDTSALSYLQLIEESEVGDLFIGADGKVRFRARNTSVNVNNLIFTDDGTGVGYQNILVTYGSELLYNDITATSKITNDVVNYANTSSQNTYGILSYESNPLLVNSLSDLETYAQWVLGKYDEPEYRFEAIDIELTHLSAEYQNAIINLELGDIILVKFTPNGIAPAIERYESIVRIEQTITPENHTVTFGLAAESIGFILDSAAFGKLDVNSLGW